MHIEFVRTGGFAGLRLAASLDTQKLPTEQASNLDKLLSDVDFFQLPESIIPDSPLPDRFEYHVTVSASKKTHSIVVNDSVAPETLRPLLNYLTTLALVSKKS